LNLFPSRIHSRICKLTRAWRTTTTGHLLVQGFTLPIQFEPSGKIWGTWAPPRCKFFTWLASLNRCWTTDHLARRGLDQSLQCLLCDKEDETIHHIMVGCIFSIEVWFQILSLVGLQGCTLESGRGKFSRMVENSRVKGAQASPCGVQLACVSHLVESLEAPQCVCL
jgi:hypothetical protein